MGKYYVIDRWHQTITLDYIKEHLEDGWFKCFDTYEEARDYDKKACFDDSAHGVFYRTENDEFLCVQYCLS